MMFENITKINGAGTSDINISYNYNHENPEETVNYYRLKQTDYDGKYTYSSIIAIDNTDIEKSNKIFVYPNPTKNIINIKIDTQNKGIITIALLNELGESIIYKSIEVEKGTNTTQLDIKDVAAGMYELKTTINGVITYKKIIIQ